MQAILQLPVQRNPAAPCKSLSTAPNLDASCFNLSQSWPNIDMGHCLIKAAQDLLHPLEPCLQASLLQHVLQVVTPALQMVAVLGGCHRMRCGCQLLRRVACAVGRAVVFSSSFSISRLGLECPPGCKGGGSTGAARVPCHTAEQGACSARKRSAVLQT